VNIISFLVLIGLLLLLFTGLLIHSLPQVRTGLDLQKTVSRSTPTQAQDNDTGPLDPPGNVAVQSLQLPTNQYVVYEQQNNIYYISTAGGLPQVMNTPGYIYNRAVPPLLTPEGQILYSGDGLWLTDVVNGSPVQLATLDAGQVITSMALSADGTTVAWSSEPVDGNGNVNLYAGPLEKSSLIYQHTASACPCFRVFSFMNAQGSRADGTLLLTDDRGDHRAVQNGLWQLSLTSGTATDPVQLLQEDPRQGPLALAPGGTTLLYSSLEGSVPIPEDGSVPSEIADQGYANSLDVASIDAGAATLRLSHQVLEEQHDLSNTGAYHWVTTPVFSADGRVLIYIVFSSDTHYPFDRHYALFALRIDASARRLHVGAPQLLSVATSRFVELGPWMSNNILTFYSDGSLYALNTRTGAVATIAQTAAYARIIAVIGQDGV
jgi:outer membrane protein assembly factor BamB